MKSFAKFCFRGKLKAGKQREAKIMREAGKQQKNVYFKIL